MFAFLTLFITQQKLRRIRENSFRLCQIRPKSVSKSTGRRIFRNFVTCTIEKRTAEGQICRCRGVVKNDVKVQKRMKRL